MLNVGHHNGGTRQPAAKISRFPPTGDRKLPAETTRWPAASAAGRNSAVPWDDEMTRALAQRFGSRIDDCRLLGAKVPRGRQDAAAEIIETLLLTGISTTWSI
jgi:hypothetical protein